MTPAHQHAALQRRTIGTLVGSQVLGGVGVASGIAVMALLARDVSGSDQLSGLGTTAQVLGGALITIPVARLSARRGRRPAQLLGYGLAVVGALLVVLAAVLGSFAVLLAGALLFGGATTSNSQARYAGADLAADEHRGRDLSLVVWAATIGSVLGPNLVEPAEDVARALRMPHLTGSFVFSVLGFVLAMLVLHLRLRPDPLVVARREEVAEEPETADRHVHGSLRSGVAIVAARPAALAGLLVTALGHAVMIAVMVMTPLHMDHGGASLQLIGLVISIHILGMYAFSPLTGLAVDRVGPVPVALVGSVVLFGACLLASTTQHGMSGRLTTALFLLGLGWSCTLVSGSSMLVRATGVRERPATQGVADVCMGLAGAAAGATAGVVLENSSFHALALGGAALAVLIGLAAVSTRWRRGVEVR